MAANGENTSEDAEMSVCSGDAVVTMMDVLQEQQDFEDDANAVLGASDDKNCTYSKGYVKRQAIYACLTCCPEAKDDPSKRAGVCLACSLNCHENHELIELYTKRNFCCDCGNPKFNSHPCTFTPNKNDLNYENKYNQNFCGIYCVCHRPYPDPEADEEEEMLQCIVCEDWLHTKHLEATVPHNELYEEMICKDCMEEYDFLHDYSELVVNVVDKEVVVDEFDFNFDLKKSSRKGKSIKAVSNGKVDVKSDRVDDIAEIVQINGKEEKVEKTASAPEKIEDKVEGSNDNLPSNENKDSEMDSSNLLENKEIDKSDQSDTVKPADDSKSGETMNGEPSSDDQKAENIVSEENKSTEEIEKAEEITEKNNTNENISGKDTENQNIFEQDKEENQNTTEQDKAENQNNTEQDKAENPNISEQDKAEKVNITEQDKAEHQNITEQDKPEHQNITEQDKAENQNTTEQDKKAETTKEQEKNIIEDPEKMEEDRLLQDDAEIKPSTEPNSEPGKNEDETKNEIVDFAPSETKSSDVEQTENNETTEKKEQETEEANLDTTKTDGAAEATPIPVENSDNKRKLNGEVDDDVVAKKPKLDGKPCIRPRGVKRVYKGATFWPSNLRQKLCTCNECISMYKDLAVLFLIDPEDTVNAYEALGKEISEGPSSQYEKGLQALSSLDRVQQINALTEYNKMRDKLLDFLKGYKDRKEIVKEEDIKSFFAGMKPKREPDGVYFCR